MHTKLFRNVSETNNVSCETYGTIPNWLEGNLYRNGPGLFDFEKQTVSHWFDGMGLLHHFKIKHNEVTYQSKFVQSSAFKAASQHQQLTYKEFATDPCAHLFKRFFTRFNQNFTTNTLVNLCKIDDTLVSLTETPQPIIFDPETLTTQGDFKFNDNYVCNLNTAHPHYDRRSKTLVNLAIRMGMKNYYEFFKIKNKKRSVISSIEVKKPSYQHSFGMTENYLILVDSPFKVSSLSLLLKSKPFIEHFKWEDCSTIFHIICKKTGDKKCSINAPSFFMFHQINAFEKEDKIYFDSVTFKDSSVIDALYLKNLRSKDLCLPQGFFTRFELNLTQQTCKTIKKLHHLPIEMPQINYTYFNAKAYNFVYGLNSRKFQFFDRIIKLNTTTEKTLFYYVDGCIPSEPVFVQKPNSKDEDAGVLLSILLNTKDNKTELHGIDAKTMKMIFKSCVDGLSAFSFHGQFFNSKKVI